MRKFLQKRTRVLETIMINRPSPSSSKTGSHHSGIKKQNFPRVSTNAMTENPSKEFPMCPACEKQRHSLMDCLVFNGMNVRGRLKVVNDKKLCGNCFRSDHFALACRSKFSCKHCSKRHHSMIHPGHIEVQANPDLLPGPSRVVTAIATTETMAPYCNAHVLASSAAVNGTSTSVLLSTVVLIIVDAYGQEHFARARLDTGSQPNAISERLCQQLHLTRTTVNVPISGVDGSLTNAKHQVTTELRSRAISTPCCVTDGSNCFTIFQLVETVFGWIVAGRMESNDLGEKVACHVAQIPSIDDQLERFWNLEEVSGTNYSVDEQQCEDFYRRTVSRNNSGRYIVRMPRHPQFEQMFGSSKETTLQRFRRLERMLERKPELKPQYHDFIREYIALGHMTEVPDGDVDRPDACYLPHHLVVKESSSTTKVRVVFDGSAKTSSGHSLNEALLVGPVVQDELITNVLRFRQFPIALVADIEKMYRQVSLHPDDRPLQRIFWRFNSIEPIKAYELSTITYGLAPSSFLATRTLQQVVEDEGSNFPEASRVVKKDVYVDD
ncbi:uncharacterized protein LOC129766315 [Toxorhynchites rutilus septentrionalis]|uniref:uncharacterized protein LOC129766315 n=1 Tax=Toxorhynchites rutilus septentrionalis TaxID=329112 RepID=UPI002478B971|nr:uncharacterized protein LOC129766315 [Toxorhynchites rutilus septentrionalis]